MLLVGYIFDQWKVCISVIVKLNKVNLLNCGVITLGLIGSSMLLGLGAWAWFGYTFCLLQAHTWLWGHLKSKN